MSALVGPWISVVAANRRDALVEAVIRQQEYRCPICGGKPVVSGRAAFCENAPYCVWTGTLTY